jgi:hypothetical protein
MRLIWQDEDVAVFESKPFVMEGVGECAYPGHGWSVPRRLYLLVPRHGGLTCNPRPLVTATVTFYDGFDNPGEKCPSLDWLETSARTGNDEYDAEDEQGYRDLLMKVVLEHLPDLFGGDEEQEEVSGGAEDGAVHYRDTATGMAK